MAELADALASGASSRKGVEVRVLSRAPLTTRDLRRTRRSDDRRVIVAGVLPSDKLQLLPANLGSEIMLGLGRVTGRRS